jgi:hypothetical protein
LSGRNWAKRACSWRSQWFRAATGYKPLAGKGFGVCGGPIRGQVAGLRLFGGSSFHLANAFFHLFARLECHHELLWHKDFIASARIASFACSPLFYLENAEVPELDSMVFHQGFNDGIERLLNDFLGLELGEPDLIGNGFNDFFLGHFGIPFEDRPFRRKHAQFLGVTYAPSVGVATTSVKIVTVVLGTGK